MAVVNVQKESKRLIFVLRKVLIMSMSLTARTFIRSVPSVSSYNLDFQMDSTFSEMTIPLSSLFSLEGQCGEHVGCWPIDSAEEHSTILFDCSSPFFLMLLTLSLDNPQCSAHFSESLHDSPIRVLTTPAGDAKVMSDRVEI